MRTLDIATILCIATMAGVEIAVSAFFNPILWQLRMPEQARAVSLSARSLGRVMPFWYVASLILLIIEIVLHRPHPARVWMITSASIWAAVILFTVGVLVPVNTRIARLNPEAPFATWLQDHHRWDLLHRIRVVALLAACACFLYGLLVVH